MKTPLLGVTLALGLSAASLVAPQAYAAPADQFEEIYSAPPPDPSGTGLPSAPLGDGNLVFELVGIGTGFLAPVIGPVVGNQGIQGLLLPLLIVGQQGLALLPQIPFTNDVLSGIVQPALGVLVPAASPIVLGLLTLDPALLVSGGINFVDVLLTGFVPALLGELPVLGTLGDAGLPVVGTLLGGLPVIGSLGSLEGLLGGIPVLGSLGDSGLPVVGTLLGGLPVVGSLGSFSGLLGGVPVLGTLGGGLPVVGVLGNGGLLDAGLLGAGTGLVTGVLGGLI